MHQTNSGTLLDRIGGQKYFLMQSSTGNKLTPWQILRDFPRCFGPENTQSLPARRLIYSLYNRFISCPSWDTNFWTPCSSCKGELAARPNQKANNLIPDFCPKAIDHSVAANFLVSKTVAAACLDAACGEENAAANRCREAMHAHENRRQI